MKLGEIADALDLVVEGDALLEIRALSGLGDAAPGDLSFATDGRYIDAFRGSAASAFILPADFDADDRPCLRSPTPYIDFAKVIHLLMPEAQVDSGVHPTAIVAPSAKLEPDVRIGAYSVIGERVRIASGTQIHAHVSVYADCVIGEDCEIHAGAHLRSRVRLGSRVTIQNGAVIGAEGFGFAFSPEGTRVRVPHRSGVVLEDDVEIGANSTIDASHPGHPRNDRSSSATFVGRGVKIDNLVQVAHGCEIAEGSTLCAQVGLAGRTRIGRNVFMGGGSATSGDLHVGEGTAVLGMSGVMSDTEPGSQLVGVPVMPRKAFFRMIAATRRLPELLKRVARLEERSKDAER